MFREIPIPADQPGRGWSNAGRAVHIGSYGEVSVRDGGGSFWTNSGTDLDLSITTSQLEGLLERNQLKLRGPGEWDDPDHPTAMFIRAETHRRVYEALADPVERKTVLKTLAAQEATIRKFSRWRLFGGVEDGKPFLFLVTEFCCWTDGNDEFWDSLAGIASTYGAYLQTMDERMHVDRYAPARGTPGERVTDDPVHVPDREVGVRPDRLVWAEGPHHGRRERHVEMLLPVLDYTPNELVRHIEGQLDAATQALWEKAGVALM